MNIGQVPYEERVPDSQYRNMLIRALREGKPSITQQSKKRNDPGKVTYSLLSPVTVTYDYRNGWVMETCRKIGKAGINEGFALANGVRDNEELNKVWGVPFWNTTFEDPEKCKKRGLAPGDLGPASYAVLHDFPTPDGPFNQIQAVIEQIKELPHLKTHTMTTLYPPGIYRGKDKRQLVVTVPCHGTVINVIIVDDKLHLTVVNRSTDLALGEIYDRLIYASYHLALCHVTRYDPGLLNFVYINPHYYGNQREVLEEMVSREPRPFPTVALKEPPDDFFAFRKEHFEITDYHPHPAIKDIPISA